MFKMYLYIYFCALMIASAHSGNLVQHDTNRSQNQNYTSKGPEMNVRNKTKLTLVSEGGTLFTNTLQKQNSLLTLDEELSKTKEKAVVPRKGVDNMLADLTSDEKNSTVSELNKTSNITPSVKSTTKSPLATSTKTAESTVKMVLLFNATVSNSNTSTGRPKKPLTLSAESIANWEKQLQSEQPKIHIAPSTETMASSQISSPNKDSIVKVYPTKANSHPGMIMPIVITILVVPMFAIVGYMVLKRGQEAWKNRHYKRMDFLLDGMYND